MAHLDTYWGHYPCEIDLHASNGNGSALRPFNLRWVLPDTGRGGTQKRVEVRQIAASYQRGMFSEMHGAG